MAVAREDLSAAEVAFQAGLDIRLRLAETDPTNAQAQRDLSVSHERLGDLAVGRGDLSAADTAFQAGLRIRLRLAEADPTNAQAQDDLVAIQQRLAYLDG